MDVKPDHCLRILFRLLQDSLWLRPRSVPTIDNLTLAAYQEQYEGQLPVVWRGAYQNLSCLEDGWIEKAVMKPFGKERVVFVGFGKGEERVMSAKLETFLSHINKNTQEAWSYIQDDHFLRRHPELMWECPPMPAELQKEDLFALAPARFAPQNATLLWGGRFSRSRLHVDNYNWTGTNLVLRGEKFVRLIPPGGHDHHLKVTIRSCGSALECVNYEAAADLFEGAPQGVPIWEAKLTSGDLLLIPSGWWHQAVNLGNTLALASGLITPQSGSWSAVAEVVKYHHKVHPNWTWGRLPSPPAPKTKLPKDEATRIFRRFINSLPDGAVKAAEKWHAEARKLRRSHRRSRKVEL
ncbi:unnamed protein product [Symbiodinium pilosum]|uniref:JmjC domain-containing protein n=1 Tax=Symbiodinium pilosum TaxID=2952 RepID=A0A812QH85_SYMPI|nr:unnamed protein product [Symbiodinium pilosum]